MSVAAEGNVMTGITEAGEDGGSKVAMFMTKILGLEGGLKIQSSFGFSRPISRRVQKQTGLDILQNDLHRIR